LALQDSCLCCFANPFFKSGLVFGRHGRKGTFGIEANLPSVAMNTGFGLSVGAIGAVIYNNVIFFDKQVGNINTRESFLP
jgi:hypothetical protein